MGISCEGGSHFCVLFVATKQLILAVFGNRFRVAYMDSLEVQCVVLHKTIPTFSDFRNGAA